MEIINRRNEMRDKKKGKVKTKEEEQIRMGDLDCSRGESRIKETRKKIREMEKGCKKGKESKR